MTTLTHQLHLTTSVIMDLPVVTPVTSLAIIQMSPRVRVGGSGYSANMLISGSPVDDLHRAAACLECAAAAGRSARKYALTDAALVIEGPAARAAPVSENVCVWGGPLMLYAESLVRDKVTSVVRVTGHYLR